MPLTFEIITPEGSPLALAVDSVTLPTANGQITILPGHQPIIGQTVAGELIYRAQGQEHSYAIDIGFFTLQRDKLSLLVEGAADTAQIDMGAIEKARERALAALKNAEKLDPAEVEEFERIARFALAQKLIKKR
jgi:F-type H+-transporting ATPase subunit epsilon